MRFTKVKGALNNICFLKKDFRLSPIRVKAAQISVYFLFFYYKYDYSFFTFYKTVCIYTQIYV